MMIYHTGIALAMLILSRIFRKPINIKQAY